MQCGFMTDPHGVGQSIRKGLQRGVHSGIKVTATKYFPEIGSMET